MMEVLMAFGVNLAGALAPVLVTLLAALAALGVKYLSAKIGNAYLSGVVERLNTHTWQIVQSLQQTMVAELKDAASDGKLTDAEKSRIYQSAVNKIKTYLGPAGLQELSGVLGFSGGELDTYLHDRVEATVHEMKVRDNSSLRVPIKVL